MSLRQSSALLPLHAIAAIAALAATNLAFEPVAMAAPGSASAPKRPDERGNATSEETPPPATPPPATPAPKEEEKEDRRAVYISLDIGFTRPDIGAIKNDLAFDKTAANGLLAGIGLGYRYRELRIGARFRDSSTTEFSLWSLMGELGYGLPFRPVSPIFTVHAGYMFSTDVQRAVIASSLPQGNLLTPQVKLDGLIVGAEIGASYWLTKFLRLGPFIGFDLTWLHRSQVALPQSILPIPDATKNNALFGDSGSGVGYILNIGLRGTGDISF